MSDKKFIHACHRHECCMCQKKSERRLRMNRRLNWYLCTECSAWARRMFVENKEATNV